MSWMNDDLPAPQHGANHALHGRSRLRAGVVRKGVHGHRDVAHHHVVVDGDAQKHVVNGLVGRPLALALDFKRMRLGVQHLAFDVPQTVVAPEAAVGDVARVHGLAG